MMKGYLSTKGIHAAEGRIGSVLKEVHRPYHEARCQACSDHLWYVGSSASRPWKGVLPDTVHAGDAVTPSVQSGETALSTDFIYTTLLQLMDQEEINMEDNLVKYCVSNLTSRLCHTGLTSVAESWNAHMIPGKGIPNHFAEPGCKRRITSELLPHSFGAADLYRQHVGSALTTHSTFGVDPFTTVQDKLRTENHFSEKYPDISHLFHRAVNNNFAPYKQALLYLTNTTQRNA
ncbi:uncharacterized protein LOC131344101 isoform X2 [Hemibagrus wyckioides]|uniref:uncharacterized protein LOC131344101 isoform X2 n=1 Tax=Hemibagrus wyckioides TaxID=337641 RepID=UPI00266DBEB0|nr:uncharacterized protein LOC131344101 isoform X2 [Hemibagrus wyckioides]